MTAVLIHIGCTGPYISGFEPPACLEHCIDQYLVFNDADLHVLTDRASIPLLKKRAGVFPAAIEDYASDKVARFESLYHHGPREFWTVSATRFIYLENFLRERDLRHVYHFENDVLIYFNIEEYDHVFRQLYQNLAVTPGGPGVSMTGFMYIDGHSSLEHMTTFFIDTLAEFGVEGTMKQYGLYGVEEMQLMRLYSTIKGADCMGLLPILPFGEFSQNFDCFGAIFDPATWGQFVGGTRVIGPGAKPSNHYIGQMLGAHPEYKVDWKVESSLRVPYFSYGGNLVKINNLHIHSKNMCPYMSKECE